MTKAEVIAAISDKTRLDKIDVSSAIEVFFETIKITMSEGENIYVRGFGTFVNKRRVKKILANNSDIINLEHFVPSFKPAKVFSEKIKTSSRINQR